MGFISAVKSFLQAAPPTRAKHIPSEPKPVKPKQFEKDTISKHPSVGEEAVWQGKKPPHSP